MVNKIRRILSQGGLIKRWLLYSFFLSIAGQLHYPTDVCGSLFRRELSYWGIDEGFFDTCCLSSFSAFTNSEMAMERLRNKLEVDPSNCIRDVLTCNHRITKSTTFREKIWLVLNSPRSSFAALVSIDSQQTFHFEDIRSGHFRLIVWSKLGILPCSGHGKFQRYSVFEPA